MHAYYSNGILGCELGHWWELVQQHAQVTLAELAMYAAMWQGCPTSPAAKQVAPQRFFEEKLWRDAGDFLRGMRCICIGASSLRRFVGRNPRRDCIIVSSRCFCQISL